MKGNRVVNCNVTEETSGQCNYIDELRDSFYSNSKRNSVFHVCLNASGLLLQRDTSTGTSKEHLVKMSEIVGGRCVRLQKPPRFTSNGSCGACTPTSSNMHISHSDGNEDAYLYVFAYILKKNMRKTLRRERTVITLRFRSFDSHEDNMREADKWYKTLRLYKESDLIHNALGIWKKKMPSRRLLVMLNPKSGSGKAREFFHQHVVPVLNEAEVPYDMYVTKHSNYAFDFIRRRDLSVWSGIVAVGGDGLFHEVLNGLLKRVDWDRVIGNISLGIIPCGSGNGLARSIAHCHGEPYGPKPILGAALTVVSGNSATMDVVEVELNEKIIYSFLSVGWGLISDIDIESERLRPLGYQRFTIWTLHRLLNLRTYRGRLSYIPKNNRNIDSRSFNTESHLCSAGLQHSLSCNEFTDNVALKNVKSCDYFGESDFEDVISLETLANQSFRSRCGSWLSSGSRKSTYYSIAESVYHSIADNSENNESDLDNIENLQYVCLGEKRSTSINNLQGSWVVVDGDFVMIHAAYQTHLGSDCHFSPESKLTDGTIHLVIIRGGISRTQLLTFLLNMSSGTHLPSENTEFIQAVGVKAFRLEPHENNGILTVDGERVECGTIQAKIIPEAVNIMIPNSGNAFK